jgi:hypothetical protein
VKHSATLFLEIRVHGIASKEQMAKREAMMVSLADILEKFLCVHSLSIKRDFISSFHFEFSRGIPLIH